MSVQQNQFSSISTEILPLAINQAAGTAVLGAALTGVTGGPGTGVITNSAQAYEIVGFLLTAVTAATVAFSDSTNTVTIIPPLAINAESSIKWDLNNNQKIATTAAGGALSITVTGGTVTGFILYKLNPQAVL